jgi:hypothetical protein
MSYCTLEEAWGSDFRKQKKKSRKEKKLESQEQKMLRDSVDPQILIPETHRMADYRQEVLPEDLPKPDTPSIGPYDSSFDSYISPYQRYRTDPVQEMNETVLQNNKHETLISELEQQPVDDLVHMTQSEYHKLKDEVVEGFINTTDDQFNQLILYIFTGIFYLLMLDMMYQLGKKSY